MRRSFPPIRGLVPGIAAISLIFFAGCREDEEPHDFPPAIDVGGAEPQDTPIPTGDPNSPIAPQIQSMDAPLEVLPGQVVGIRMTTDFSPPEDITGAAVIIDGLEGWYRFQVDPQPAASSDPGAWLITIPLTVAQEPEDDALARVSIALLGPDDGAGAYRNWAPELKSDGTPLVCPDDADCSAQACGLDPLCATECGSCAPSQACNTDFVCEDIGDACPEAAMCGEMECGLDPVCGVECGTCADGQYCTPDGTCTFSGGGRWVSSFANGSVASHSCAIFDDASVACWGDNMAGQLGVGDLDARGDQDGEMGGALASLDIGGSAQMVAVGDQHTCTLRTDGDIVCWGSGINGALGTGNVSAVGDQPDERVSNLTAVDLGFSGVDSLCAGDQFNCALSDTGAVKCWGRNDYGQLAQGDTLHRGDQADELGASLVAVDLGGDASALSCGRHHACAVLGGGAVKCWGRNAYGQLGQGDTNNRGDEADELANLSNIDLGAGRSAVQISAGGQHTCALLDDDSVKCWGLGFWGNLGLEGTDVEGDEAGEMGDQLAALDLGAGTPLSVSAGDRHTCVLFGDGALRCFGYPWALGVGDTQGRGHAPGTMGDELEDVDLADLAVQAIHASGDFTCASLAEGRGQCWGFNDRGQLGIEDTATRGDEPGEMGAALPIVEL
jgi:alpha-tubulin suppressor-like RCC1 family protein